MMDRGFVNKDWFKLKQSMLLISGLANDLGQQQPLENPVSYAILLGLSDVYGLMDMIRYYFLGRKAFAQKFRSFSP
jgi:hypothetical protein